MFNPERLLGGLLRGGMRRRRGGMGSLLKGGATLGLVGIAWEAVEHYMNRSQGDAQSMPSSEAASGSHAPSGGSPPPPPAGAGQNTTALPDQQQSAAVLLIRAMIAAANADGTIDAAERAGILEKLKSMPLSKEEYGFITHELLDPKDIPDIVADVASPEQARQVYMASVLAIEVDTDEELEYLQRLAQSLNLEPAAVQRIHEQLGVEIYF